MRIPDNYRGTDVSYANICDRRAWLGIHEIFITDGTEYVKLGKFVNDIQRKFGYAELTIGRNKIDYVEFLGNKQNIIIHEFKRGRHAIKADYVQITHYMYLAKYH
ncbi:MAG: Dna2/Cas4 domain-containing protein, partial [Thermoplasmata archaeon]